MTDEQRDAPYESTRDAGSTPATSTICSANIGRSGRLTFGGPVLRSAEPGLVAALGTTPATSTIFPSICGASGAIAKLLPDYCPKFDGRL